VGGIRRTPFRPFRGSSLVGTTHQRNMVGPGGGAGDFLFRKDALVMSGAVTGERTGGARLEGWGSGLEAGTSWCADNV